MARKGKGGSRKSGQPQTHQIKKPRGEKRKEKEREQEPESIRDLFDY